MKMMREEMGDWGGGSQSLMDPTSYSLPDSSTFCVHLLLEVSLLYTWALHLHLEKHLEWNTVGKESVCISVPSPFSYFPAS